ncbi:MAG: thiamine-phosphate kinase [Oceanicaulis sp.]
MGGEGEFAFIARALQPLTRGHSGAYGLKDDGAILAPPTDHKFAVTTDTLVEGVHFPVGEDPAHVGWKALSVNVSDLVAMGAQPKAYLLNLVWPKGGFEARADGFVEGLRQAQDEYGLVLAGGDTTSADGPWMVSITAFAETLGGKTPRRGGAKAGDVLVATNSIGAAWLGLQLHLGAIKVEDETAQRWFERRFSRPRPPVEIAGSLREMAHAAIDVSDGLLADVGHILSASGLAGTVELSDIPLDGLVQTWLDAQPDALAARLKLATGGDDYQIAAAMPESVVPVFREKCAEHGHAVRVIGRLERGEGLTVTLDGEPIDPGRLGFTHF